MEKEFRFLPEAQLRFQSSTTEAPSKFIGYAAVFNALSRPIGNMKEIIRPGAFKESLASKQQVRATLDHRTDLTLGLNTSGTLRLNEDNRGLAFSVDMPDTSYSRDLSQLVQRGDVFGCSFGFWSDPKKFWTEKTRGLYRREDNLTIREYHAIDLFDISIVYEPTWLQTEVSTRSWQDWNKEQDRKQEVKRLLIENKLRWLKTAKNLWD